MSLFRNLFGNNRSLKECPRCLGKGHVDWDDIRRLNQELRWMPGTCAYCNGSGEVDNKIEHNVPVDASYLVVNLEEEERKKIISGHPDALERGKQHDEQVETFINQICYLHFDNGLNCERIAKFFLIGLEESHSYQKAKEELIDYAERVIQKRKNLDSNQ
jgi:hypothetical protein